MLRLIACLILWLFCLINPVLAEPSPPFAKKLSHTAFDTHSLCEALRPTIHHVQKIAVYIEQMLAKGKQIPKYNIQRLKNSTLSRLEKDGGLLVSSGSEISYFRSIVDRLMTHVDQPFDYELYYLKNTKIDNAFAIPPNVLVLTEAFLAHLSNEAQLSVILGHELGHLYFEHSLALVAILNDMIDIDIPQVRLLVSLIAKNLIHLLYGNQLEEQADAWGLELTYLAGYDISSMESFWFELQKQEILEDKNKKQSNQPSPQTSNSYLSKMAKMAQSIKNHEMVQNTVDQVKNNQMINQGIESSKKLISKYLSAEDLAYWKKFTIEKTEQSIAFMKDQVKKLKPEIEALLSSHPAHELRACIAKEMNEQLILILGKNAQKTNSSNLQKIKH